MGAETVCVNSEHFYKFRVLGNVVEDMGTQVSADVFTCLAGLLRSTSTLTAHVCNSLKTG